MEWETEHLINQRMTLLFLFLSLLVQIAGFTVLIIQHV